MVDPIHLSPPVFFCTSEKSKFQKRRKLERRLFTGDLLCPSHTCCELLSTCTGSLDKQNRWPCEDNGLFVKMMTQSGLTASPGFEALMFMMHDAVRQSWLEHIRIAFRTHQIISNGLDSAQKGPGSCKRTSRRKGSLRSRPPTKACLAPRSATLCCRRSVRRPSSGARSSKHKRR